jgi:EAL domain-containing protein (putative c-di-GMP-specific phosphodiesterase class I)
MAIGAPVLGPAPDETAIAAVHRLVDTEQVGLVFQPIVDLHRRVAWAHEALARPKDDYFRGPLEMFEAAVHARRVGELGRLHRKQATRLAPPGPLFLNVNPYEFEVGWLVRPDEPLFLARQQVCLEITESAPIDFFDQCHSVLAEIRKKGVWLAIDDLGAGYSNLRYITDLEPEVIKLDRQLITGIRPRSTQFKLLRSIVELGHEVGAKVVVEGIETVEELLTVLEARVRYAQGYLLARPAFPAPEVNWPI